MGPRAHTTSVRRIGKRQRLADAALFPAAEHASYERPVTRRDCLAGGVNEARPCPWASCKHHLALDVTESNGNYKLAFPDVDIADLAHTCSQDVADAGGATLEEIGAMMNLTRERVRQIEVRGLALIEASPGGAVLMEYLDESPDGPHLYVSGAVRGNGGGARIADLGAGRTVPR